MQEPIAPTAEPLDDAERFGKTLCGWALRKPLTRGAVCASWLAEHPERAHPPVVVRILREPFASDPDARSEWLRASWAANRFEHSRAVKILEEGIDDETGAPVVIRRWVEGEDLAQAVARRRIDASLALRIAEQLLDALEMAHAHGIAHGAIAPSNVILTPRSSIRLVDFATTPGLRARGGADVSAISAARASGFTAPEQRLGPAMEQADIWSVAACLRFVLSGTAPVAGQLPPVRIPDSHLDPDVAAILDLALAVDPVDRYESAYAMLGDIRRVMGGRKPKLGGALAPVPSQGLPEVSAPPQSSGAPSSARDRSAERMSQSGVREAEDRTAAARTGTGAMDEWRGNLFLMIAIAVLVGIASFVMFREKLAEPTETHQTH